MDFQRPQDGSGISFGYRYSGNVVGLTPSRRSSSSSSASSAPSFSFNVPKLVYNTYALASDVSDISTVAEVSSAIPGLASMTIITSENLKDFQPPEEKTLGEKILGFGLATVGTVINAAVGLVEGGLEFVEDVADAAFVAVGTAVSVVVGGVIDGVEGLTTGEWDFDTAKDMMDWTAQAAAFDLVGTGFDAIYSVPPMSWIDEQASNFVFDGSRGGTFYGITESVGYYTATIVASTLTGVPAGVFVGASAAGDSLEKEFGALYSGKNPEDVTWGELASVVNYSTLKGAVSGLIFTMAGWAKDATALASAPQWFQNLFSNPTSPLLKSMTGLSTGLGTSIGIKTLKPLINEILDLGFKGDEFEVGAVMTDALGIIISELLCARAVEKFPELKTLFGDPKAMKTELSNVPSTNMSNVPSGPTSALGNRGSGAATSAVTDKIAKLWQEFQMALATGENKGTEKAIKETSASFVETVVPDWFSELTLLLGISN